MRLSKIATVCLLMLLLSQVSTAQSENFPQFSEPTQQTSADRQKILFLNTYQSGLPIPDSIERGLLAALHEGGGSVSDIFIERLDFAREPSKEYRIIMADLLRHKLADKRIGVVIVEGRPALDFLTTEAKDLFPDAVLLSLVTPGIDSFRDSPYKIIDIPWRVDPAGTLKVAIDLFPKTRRVVVVTGARDGVLPFLEEAKRAFAQWKTLDFEFTNEMTYEQMLNRISSLPSDSIIIYSPFFADTSGRSFVPAEVVARVCQLATVPVFATLEAYLGRGIVGGALLKTETIGHQAGKIALDYLSGHLELTQPITSFNTSTSNIFDWHQLERWEAKTSALSKDSVIINRPLTLMGQYKREVNTAVIVFLCLSAMVLTLLMLNRRLKRLTVVASDSEARFRVMMEYAPEAIVIYDLDINRIIDANPTAEQFFGCTRQMLLKENLERFYQSDPVDEMGVAESMAECHRRALAGEEVRFEQTVYTDDERELQCEIRLVQLPYKGQRLLRASLIDITERKQAEEELRKSEGHLRTLVQTIPDLIWLKDKDGAYLSCNPIFELFFGAKESNIIGKTDYDFVDRELADFFLENDRKAMAAGKPLSNEEWITFANDGHRVLLETIKTPMYDSQGSLIGVLGIGRDITDRKNAEEENSKLEVQLQQAQKMEAIGTLAGGVAHDFNNILSSVLGFTELALDAVEKESTIAEDLYEVHTAGLRAKELVNQILTYARQSDEDRTPVQVDLIIKEVLKFIRSIIPTSIEIKQNIESNSLIMGNSTQIHRLIMNLCTNAAHAMEDKGGTLEISLHDITIDKTTIRDTQRLKAGNYLEIKVSDTGYGIEPQIIEKIFEPYFTTKKPDEGTGMGLAMVHGIVETYGGKIFVESKLDEGTAFTIYLPVVKKRNSHLFSKSDEVPTGQERILFVDDEEQIVKMSSRMLGLLGYSVTTSTNSVEALEIFRSKPHDFDLVISDVTMPKMNGEQLAKEVLEVRPDIPVILCTGYSKKLSEKNISEIGIKALAYKPIVKEDFAKTVRNVLDLPKK